MPQPANRLFRTAFQSVMRISATLLHMLWCNAAGIHGCDPRGYMKLNRAIVRSRDSGGLMRRARRRADASPTTQPSGNAGSNELAASRPTRTWDAAIMLAAVAAVAEGFATAERPARPAWPGAGADPGLPASDSRGRLQIRQLPRSNRSPSPWMAARAIFIPAPTPGDH